MKFEFIPKVFISTPMNGKNRAEIEKEMDRLLAQAAKTVEEGEPHFEAVEVVPSLLPEEFVETHSPLNCLVVSLHCLAEAHIAIFGKGWKEARGCRIEHQCATDYEIPVVIEENDDGTFTVVRNILAKKGE